MKKIFYFTIVVMIILSGCSSNEPASNQKVNQKTSTNETDQAEQLLYQALANAAEKQSIRVAMYRATYADKESADSNKNPYAIWSSISEVSTQTSDYRNVYAYKLADQKGFTVGRCLRQKEYRNFNDREQAKPTSLAAVVQKLKHLQFTTEALTFSPCPNLGLIPGAIPFLAAARLSDGIFPVTLSKAQATKWKSLMQTADMFDVKDEGIVTKDGRQLHKVSFVPKLNKQDVNQKLYEIFFEAGEIKKLQDQKKANPNIRFEFEFISNGVNNTDGVGGFYLIDPTTKLPVYSELGTIGKDRKVTTQSTAAGYNLSRTKQSYTFPDKLSLDENSSLEFLESSSASVNTESKQ
jgi:hypothetical protein